MKKLLLGLLFMAVFQFSYSQINYSAENKKVDSLIIKKMKELKIPSMAIAII